MTDDVSTEVLDGALINSRCVALYHYLAVAYRYERLDSGAEALVTPLCKKVVVFGNFCCHSLTGPQFRRDFENRGEQFCAREIDIVCVMV